MARPRPRGAASGTMLRAPRVLVLDDDPMWREVMRRWLQAAGYDLTVVADAQTATEAMRYGRHDALVTDMWLEEGSSAELLQRAAAEGLDVPPAICISGDGDAERSPRWAFVAPHLRPRRFFVKPTELHELEAALHDLLVAEEASAVG